MDKDYYSILGVTPASEDVVIRAAYRALMRRYHPDADASAEAAERAREINEAYSVLSDPEKRAHYEGSAPRSVISLEPQSEVFEQPKRSLLAPGAAIGFATLAAGMVAFALSPPDRRLRILGLATGEEARPAPQRPELVQAKASAAGAVSPCVHPSVPTLVKQELFRRATSLQSVEGETLNEAASGTRIRINSPMAASGKSGAFGCRGWLAVDMPAGLVVDEGRTNLNAEIAYEVATGSDGRLSLASLSGVNSLVRSLGTAAPPPREREPAQAPAPAQIAEKQSRKAVKPAIPAVTVATARPVAKALRPQPPAAKCSSEPNDASRMICSNDNLASLDRQLASFYRQSWEQADEPRRAALVGSRQRFNERRNACGSQNCMTGVYVARLREISDIMAGRKQR